MYLGTFIALSVFFLPFIAILIFSTWVLGLPLAAGVGLLYLNAITHEIRLTEDRISYREWFFSKEMEFQRITAVRYCYYKNTWAFWNWGPVLELSGDSGDTITISFGTLINPERLPVIYDVLKKHALRADLRKSPEEFFRDPDPTAGS
jgi:predicted outer membrane lipoprotein